MGAAEQEKLTGASLIGAEPLGTRAAQGVRVPGRALTAHRDQGCLGLGGRVPIYGAGAGGFQWLGGLAELWGCSPGLGRCLCCPRGPFGHPKERCRAPGPAPCWGAAASLGAGRAGSSGRRRQEKPGCSETTLGFCCQHPGPARQMQPNGRERQGRHWDSSVLSVPSVPQPSRSSQSPTALPGHSSCLWEEGEEETSRLELSLHRHALSCRAKCQLAPDTARGE